MAGATKILETVGQNCSGAFVSMPFLQYLKLKWSFWGIDAPAFSWLVVLCLGIWASIQVSFLIFHLLQLKRRAKSLSKEIERVFEQFPIAPNAGFSERGLEELGRLFGKYQIDSSWKKLRNHLIRTDDGTYFAIESAESFIDEYLGGKKLNRSYLGAVPGIFTGIGLLFTFLAILVALLDVRLVDNRVQGLELLIQGLSGKFISSIGALLLGTSFLIVEKIFLNQIRVQGDVVPELLDACFPWTSSEKLLVQGNQRLIEQVSSRMDHLSEVLATLQADVAGISETLAPFEEMQMDIAEQSKAMRQFNSELAPILRESVNENIKPMIDQVIRVIDELNQSVRANQAREQETMAELFKGVLSNIESSIRASMATMASSFSDSLSSGTANQFDSVVKALSGTSMVLEEMNGQMQASQKMLTDLIEQSRSTTREQMVQAEQQAVALTDLVRNLVGELQRTSGESAQNYQYVMAAAMQKVFEQVEDMNRLVRDSLIEQKQVFGETVQSATERNRAISSEVIAVAKMWTEEQATRMTALLEAVERQTAGVNETRLALENGLNQFRQTLGGYSEINQNLARTTENVSEAIRSIRNITATLGENQEALRANSALLVSQLNLLNQSQARQSETWDKIAEGVEQYQETFESVEEASSKLLAQINRQLQENLQVVQNGYKNLVVQADEHFNNATQRLAGTVSELKDVLDDLNDTLRTKAIGTPKR